jgi:hypothetical protein
MPTRHGGILANRAFYLTTRPPLPQDDRAAGIEANNVERVLADIDADHGDRVIGLL